MMILLIFERTWNAIDEGNCGSPMSNLEVIMWELDGSMAPKAENNALLGRERLKNFKGTMVIENWVKSSMML